MTRAYLAVVNHSRMRTIGTASATSVAAWLPSSFEGQAAASLRLAAVRTQLKFSAVI